MKKRKVTKVNEVIRVEKGGSLEQHRDVSYYVDAEPPFVKVYLDTILYLKDLPTKHNPVLYRILKRLPYADQCQKIGLTKHIKEEIAKEVGCSLTKVDHAISDLVKGEVIYRLARGTYQVNPNFFGRGKWSDIERLRLDITFDGTGTTIMSEISRKKRG